MNKKLDKTNKMSDKNKVKFYDIIKRKNVSMEILSLCKNVGEYNTIVAVYCGLNLFDYRGMILTQDEFELLKR